MTWETTLQDKATTHYGQQLERHTDLIERRHMAGGRSLDTIPLYTVYEARTQHASQPLPQIKPTAPEPINYSQRPNSFTSVKEPINYSHQPGYQNGPSYTDPTIFLTQKTPKQTTQTKTHTKKHPHKPNKNTQIKMSNEQFLARFASLTPKEPIPLPQNPPDNKGWCLTALAQVVTDRTILEQQFAATMLKEWVINPRTEITLVACNVFLLQFKDEKDLLKVLHRGVWTYRSDVIAIKQIHGPTDLEISKSTRLKPGHSGTTYRYRR